MIISSILPSTGWSVKLRTLRLARRLQITGFMRSILFRSVYILCNVFLSNFFIWFRGSSSTCIYSCGSLYFSRRVARYFTSASSSIIPLSATTYNTGTCPTIPSGSFTPIHAHSLISSYSCAAFSTSIGDTFSPPTLMISSARPSI